MQSNVSTSFLQFGKYSNKKRVSAFHLVLVNPSRGIKDSHITKVREYFHGAFSTAICSPAIFVQLNIHAFIFYKYNKHFY